MDNESLKTQRKNFPALLLQTIFDIGQGLKYYDYMI